MNSLESQPDQVQVDGPPNKDDALLVNAVLRQAPSETSHGCGIGRMSYPAIDKDRIHMLRDDEAVLRLPSTPLLSSANSGWGELKLEHHRLVPVDALTGVIQGYQICMHLSDPLSMQWKLNGVWSTHLLKKNDLCISTHGELRTVSWQAGFESVIVSISPKMMTDVGAEDGKGGTVELVKHRGFRDVAVEMLVGALHADVLAGNPAGPLYGEQLGLALSTYLSQRFAVFQTRGKQYRSGLSRHALQKICGYVETRLDQPISLAQLAAEARVSQFYFSRLFRNSIGESPCHFVVGRKVEKAKELLLRTKASVAEVARMTGFATNSHFTTVFRSRTGLTPTRYRRLAR